MIKPVALLFSRCLLLMALAVSTLQAAHGASLDQLIENLQSAHGDHSKLLQIITELSKMKEAAVPALIKTLESQDPNVRADAVLMLGNIGGIAAETAIIGRLRDTNGLVRQLAGHILWKGAFDPSKIDHRALLDAAFENSLHSEFLATLFGFKPVSVVQGFEPSLFENLMKEASRNGILTNSDIGWFFRADRPIPITHFYSRKAIAALLKDKTSVSLLRKNGFPKVKSVDEAISAFESFWHGTPDVSQESFDIISGIFFGYPREEVIAYAKSRRGGQQASGYDKDLFPDFGREKFLGWVVVTTKKSKEELLQMDESAAKAVAVYHAGVKAGLTATEIVNQWDQLRCSTPLE